MSAKRSPPQHIPHTAVKTPKLVTHHPTRSPPQIPVLATPFRSQQDLPSATNTIALKTPNECWCTISSFLIPPEAYSLCLVTKTFHQYISTSQHTACNCSANQILHASMVSSLTSVLSTHHNVSFVNMECARTTNKYKKADFVLSGGTMVQAVLGKMWPNSDVDIFTTSDSAPLTRTFLMSEMGFHLARKCKH